MRDAAVFAAMRQDAKSAKTPSKEGSVKHDVA
jgi:hypothetical protein